jgi:hypothetical protein
MMNRLKYKGIIPAIILIVSIFSTSCRKDKGPPFLEDSNSFQCNDCSIIPVGNFSVFDQYILDTNYLTSPQFNPNNDNEIVFIEWTSTSKKLYKFNLITSQKTLIFEGNISGSHISWGKNDWILFSLMDYQIWKIKSDGTQLTKVTSNGSWFHPEWNIDGELFITYHGYVNSNIYYSGKIWNSSGLIVDSFNWSPIIGDWNSDIGYGCVCDSRISVIDPFIDNYISDFNSNSTNYFSFNWISDDEALITSVDGIHKYNIITKKLENIKCSCNSRIYSGGTVNSHRTKIIYSLSILSRLDGSTILDKSMLVTIDVDGTNEELIEIP